MIKDFLRSYYKWVLPIASIIILGEEVFSPQSSLNKLVRYYYLDVGESASTFLIAAGGVPNRDPSYKGQQRRGKEYYDNLLLPIYEENEGRNMQLKDFIIDHITHYSAGLFLRLASNWLAIEKWNIN